MPRSFLPRNILFISGVAISHLLILLGLLSTQLGGETSSTQGSLIVSFLSDGSKQPSLKKSMITPQINSSSSKELSSLIYTETNSSHIGVEEVSRLMNVVVRQSVHNPKPHYPLASRRLKEQGLVVVKLCVNEQGLVEEAVVSKGSGFQNLDQSALKTLSQWRFIPIALNSANFHSPCFQAPVQFSLEG